MSQVPKCRLSMKCFNALRVSVPEKYAAWTSTAQKSVTTPASTFPRTKSTLPIFFMPPDFLGSGTCKIRISGNIAKLAAPPNAMRAASRKIRPSSKNLTGHRDAASCPSETKQMPIGSVLLDFVQRPFLKRHLFPSRSIQAASDWSPTPCPKISDMFTRQFARSGCLQPQCYLQSHVPSSAARHCQSAQTVRSCCRKRQTHRGTTATVLPPVL